MELPAPAVVVCESNRTRADLYGLWLDDREVRRALTRSQFADAFDAGIAVLVLDRSFGEGDTEPILDRVESEAPHCRVLGICGRSNADSGSAYDCELERPVFEPDLTERVETLFRRANYHLLLDLYYRTTAAISTYEWRADDDSVDDERYDRLRDRADRLQDPLNRLRARMTDEDTRAVLRGLTVEGVGDGEADVSFESKYRPDECSQCGRSWNEPIDGGEPVAKLGAYVWRCVDCGHVDMRADPSHQSVNSYKR